MKNKNHYGINVGSSSILMIFVILCLVSFAALSIISANADYKLTEKIADRTKAYYNACNEAEETLSSFDKALHNHYKKSLSEEEYFAAVGKNKSFIIQISDIQSLQVELTVNYPESIDTPLYQIDAWQVITTGELDYDDSLNVIK